MAFYPSAWLKPLWLKGTFDQIRSKITGTIDETKNAQRRDFKQRGNQSGKKSNNCQLLQIFFRDSTHLDLTPRDLSVFSSNSSFVQPVILYGVTFYRWKQAN